MADEAKAGGRSLTWLWMVLSLVVVAGFLVWLGTSAEPTAPVAQVEEEEADEDALEEGVVEVSRDTLAADKSRFAGQRVRVAGVEATGLLGARIFWGELGDPARQVPILVRLDSVAAAGFTVRTGQAYTITGQVEEMTDSVADVWAGQDEFTGEGERSQAAFADYYIEATRIRPGRAAAGATGSGDA